MRHRPRALQTFLLAAALGAGFTDAGSLAAVPVQEGWSTPGESGAEPEAGRREGGYAQGSEGSDGGSSAPYMSSPYLPLDHWAYRFVEYLISAGRIDNLSPFVKPYRRMDVARAIRELETSELGSGSSGWLERLRSEFAPELQALGRKAAAPWLGLQLGTGAAYVSQTHRDVLRPELEGEFSDARLLEDLRVDIEGAAGPVAGAFRGRRHGIFRHDPQFPDGRVVPRIEAPLLNENGSRVEEAYLELQTRYASVFFGRMYRNWGPPRQLGFLRSSYAYSEEEIGYRIGSERIFLTGSLASYGDYAADTTHFVAVHRLEWRPIDDLMVAINEATVHGGPSQGLDFRLVNPVSIWQIARPDTAPPHNKVGQLDVWWRAPGGMTVFGSLLADATNENESCCQMGGSVGAELSRLGPDLVLRGLFSAIQSLAYRTALPWQNYTVENIGLGWDKVDLYLMTVEADWFPAGGLLVTPRLDYQVKGEGDFRQPFPSEGLADFPRILVGEPEKTWRPSLAGRWRSDTAVPVEVEWDVGLNIITSYRNQDGDDRTEFVGGVRVLVGSPRWLFGE